MKWKFHAIYKVNRIQNFQSLTAVRISRYLKCNSYESIIELIWYSIATFSGGAATRPRATQNTSKTWRRLNGMTQPLWTPPNSNAYSDGISPLFVVWFRIVIGYFISVQMIFNEKRNLVSVWIVIFSLAMKWITSLLMRTMYCWKLLVDRIRFCMLRACFIVDLNRSTYYCNLFFTRFTMWLYSSIVVLLLFVLWLVKIIWLETSVKLDGTSSQLIHDIPLALGYNAEYVVVCTALTFIWTTTKTHVLFS